MTEKIVIIGGKGQAVVFADLVIDSINRYNAPYELLGYAIDDSSLGDNINGVPILCKIDEVKTKFHHSDVKVFFVLYKPVIMKERVALLKSLDISVEQMTNFVHPSSYVAPSAKLGLGNIICPNVVVNSNVIIGNQNIINGNALVGHDTIMGNNNIMGACSTLGSIVRIGNGNFIGVNSSVRDTQTMNDFNLVGMGSIVLRNLESNQKIVGNPGRLL